MQKISLILLFCCAYFFNNAVAQTWNIPTNGSAVGTSYIGTTGAGTNDLVFKALGEEKIRIRQYSMSFGRLDGSAIPSVLDFEFFGPWSPMLGVTTYVNSAKSWVTLGVANGGAQINSIETNGDAVLAARTGLSDLIIGGGPNSGAVRFSTSVGGIDKERMTINNDGKVSIGAPSDFGTQGLAGNYLLYVAGGIMTEKARIAVKNTADWSDFVFAPNYKLRTLDSVATFIKENKHLPDVPSAQDVVNHGIDIGKMDAILLQKIEELTLYMIELEKKNKELEKKNKAFEERLIQIEKTK